MTTAPAKKSFPFGQIAVLLIVLLLVLFAKSLTPDYTFFSNDGPLGAMVAEQNQVPETITGLWQDLNWIGAQYPAAPPTISTAFRLITTPLVFSKFYCPFSLLVLGLCAWFCFRQLKLSHLACTLATLATVLNAGFFSNSCWGVAAQTIMAGMMFLALGLVARSNHGRHSWLNIVLAGMAVGMGVMEGFDVGALLSVLIAAYVIFQSLNTEGPAGPKAARGILKVAVVAVFAAIMAASALSTLISTQIKGVGGTQQSTQTKEERWDWATQWSLPKSETLGLVIPGLFGYRMDTPKDMEMFAGSFENGAYWGAIGRDPAWDRYFASGQTGRPPQGFLRFSGGGTYGGVLVALVALWAVLQSFRKQDSVYARHERRFIWFWAAVMVIALLLAWGRFAPFYWVLYQLPYSSTVRNPIKFIHLWNFSILILFAYGLNGLSRRYLSGAPAGSPGNPTSFSSWWSKAPRFDQRWVIGSFLVVVASVLGWMIYAGNRGSLVEYLQTVGFDAATARNLAAFSIGQVGWFILFLVLSAGALVLVVRGRFAGARARTAAVVLGVVLVADLARADLPWLVYWNYKQKYATNDVIDFLREKPFEQRVAIVPNWLTAIFQVPKQFVEMQQYVEQLYRIEWAQHHFQYYDIQSLDLVQMPRMPEDLQAYRAALTFTGTRETLHLPLREWELTNTRYLISPAAFVQLLNGGLDPEKQRFRVVESFDIVPKAGVTRPTKLEELTAVSGTNGQFAVIEFTGALPRARLYSNWRVATNDPAVVQTWLAEVRRRVPLEYGNALAGRSTNDLATLYELTRPEFDPKQTLLLDLPLPAGIPEVSTNENAGTVDYESYAPKHIVLKANAVSDSILLLNDKYDPNWKVTVDGQPAELLRVNFIMRGVRMPAGAHTIEFVFEPPIGPLYVSIAAIAVGLLLVGLLIVTERRHASAAADPDKK